MDISHTWFKSWFHSKSWCPNKMPLEMANDGSSIWLLVPNMGDLN